MCLYNYNNKIYTSRLIALQNSNEHINILNDALDDLSNQ